MIRELWVGGKLVERWDDDKRRHTAFDEQGRATSRRGFNNDEKAAAARRVHPLREVLERLRERSPDARLP